MKNVLFILVLLHFGSAVADDKPCKKDMEKLCPGKTGRAARECLANNLDYASEDCQSKISKAKGEHKMKDKNPPAEEKSK